MLPRVLTQGSNGEGLDCTHYACNLTVALGAFPIDRGTPIVLLVPPTEPLFSKFDVLAFLTPAKLECLAGARETVLIVG